jgi:hypothetical protein
VKGVPPCGSHIPMLSAGVTANDDLMYLTRSSSSAAACASPSAVASAAASGCGPCFTGDSDADVFKAVEGRDMEVGQGAEVELAGGPLQPASRPGTPGRLRCRTPGIGGWWPTA